MRVRIGIAPLQKIVRGLERQTKFGASQALNELVEVIKGRSIDNLGKYFRLRSGWIAKGFRTGHATRDKLTAWVGHVDEMLKVQAEGGSKAAGKGGKQSIPQAGQMPSGPLPIPMPRGTGGERPTYRTTGNWAGNLIKAINQFESKRTKYFGKKARSKSEARARIAMNKTRAASNRLVFLKNAAIPTIAVRIGSGNGRGKYLPLWFLIRGPVKIPKRWKFYEDGESFARSNMPPLMDWHVTKAINMIGKP